MSSLANRNSYVAVCLFVGCCLSPAGGCGNAVPVGTVNGNVLLENQPVGNAELMFYSPDVGLPRQGVSMEDGAYFMDYAGLKGLPVGKYEVYVLQFQEKSGKPLESGEAGMVARQAGKAQQVCYRIEVEVQEGENAIDLKLDGAKYEGVLPVE